MKNRSWLKILAVPVSFLLGLAPYMIHSHVLEEGGETGFATLGDELRDLVEKEREGWEGKVKGFVLSNKDKLKQAASEGEVYIKLLDAPQPLCDPLYLFSTTWTYRLIESRDIEFDGLTAFVRAWREDDGTTDCYVIARWD